MRAIDFSFELPESLIAHYPMPECSSCRLSSLDGPIGALTHGTFTDLLDKLSPGDLLIFSNARVIPVRLFGREASGGKIEALVERMPDDKHILAHICASKAPKSGIELLLGGDKSINAAMTTRHGTLFEVEFNDQCSVLNIFSNIGHMPLPPYIDRSDEDADRELYQTIYNEKPNTVAAPIAGLHFDEPLLEKLRAKGVEMAFVALHVGMGTFQPVRVDTIEDHIVHSEYAEMPQDVVGTALAAKAHGNRVIAVGATSVHSLESATQATKNDLVEPFFDDAQVFIYPGFQYKVVNALVMNFHLPESTLIMPVSAFASYQHAMNTYRATIEGRYRFLSYGGMMSVTYDLQVINERVEE